MTFLVHPSDTTYFRVKISNIRAEFAQVPGEKVYLSGLFDNYFEFETPVAGSAQFPNWASFERSFVYETEMDHLLVAKRFVLAFYSQVNEGIDSFLGQASVDLLTLATGPPTIVLRIMSGDAFVGRMFFDLHMEEFTEMKISSTGIRLTKFREGFNDIDGLDVIVRKGFTSEIRTTTLTRNAADREVDVTFEPHYFGASMVFLMESTGLRFELTVPGICGPNVVGHGNLLLVSNPFIPVEGKPRNATMRFTTAIRDNDNVELCQCGGELTIENLPVFCQMSAGLTVDGVVVEGHKYPIATRVPPFTSGNVAASPIVDVA